MTQVYRNKKTNPALRLFAFLAFFSALILAGASAQASDGSKHAKSEKECDSMAGKGNDTWIQGKLEGAYLLNRHLDPTEIDTEVKNNTVFLSGNVDSEIDKDLAGEIAKSIEGVQEVKNKLTVRPENFKKDKKTSAKNESEDNEDRERGFTQKVKDASITASVKVKLLANSNTDGSDINVDTMRQTVTLRGNVHSPEEKDLAEKIAMNTEDVLKVANELNVDPSKEKE